MCLDELHRHPDELDALMESRLNQIVALRMWEQRHGRSAAPGLPLVVKCL